MMRTSNANRPPEPPRHDSAGVIAPPPLLYGAAIIVGLALHVLHPLAITSRFVGVLHVVGIVLAVLGLLLSATVVRAFGAAGTPVTPWRGTTRLVHAGPYRYSRNPDYIGQTLVYVGIALVVNSWWLLILLPLVLLAVQLGVIRREERYLEAKFGAEYRDYTTRVRRWL